MDTHIVVYAQTCTCRARIPIVGAGRRFGFDTTPKLFPRRPGRRGSWKWTGLEFLDDDLDQRRFDYRSLRLRLGLRLRLWPGLVFAEASIKVLDRKTRVVWGESA